MNERVRLNVEMSQAERQALKRLALDRGTTVKSLVTEALSLRYPTIIQEKRHAKTR